MTEKEIIRAQKTMLDSADSLIEEQREIINYYRKKHPENEAQTKAMHYIADKYGRGNQLNKACEEAAEFIAAICKGNIKDVTEETADLEIMIEQLKYLLKIDTKKMVKYKLFRQLERIRKGM